MPRYIDIDAFRADYQLGERCGSCERYGKKDCDYPSYSARDFCGWLDDVPTVDTVPVKHGEWNHVGTLERYVGMKLETCSEFRCSVCDSPQTFFVPIAHYNFCPMCGAKMDGEANE